MCWQLLWLVANLTTAAFPRACSCLSNLQGEIREAAAAEEASAVNFILDPHSVIASLDPSSLIPLTAGQMRMGSRPQKTAEILSVVAKVDLCDSRADPSNSGQTVIDGTTREVTNPRDRLGRDRERRERGAR